MRPPARCVVTPSSPRFPSVSLRLATVLITITIRQPLSFAFGNGTVVATKKQHTQSRAIMGTHRAENDPLDHPQTEEPRIADSRQKLTKDDHGPGLPQSLLNLVWPGRAPPTAKPWTGDKRQATGRQGNRPHKNKPANAPPFTHPRIPPPHARPNQKNIVQTSRSPLRCPSCPHTPTLSQSLTSLQLLLFRPFSHSTRYIHGEIVSAPGAAFGAPTAASPPLANALGDSRLFPRLRWLGRKQQGLSSDTTDTTFGVLCALLRHSPSRSIGPHEATRHSQ